MSKKSSNFAPAFEKKGRVKRDESVAQQVEHIPFKDGVLGSSPSWFTEREFRLSFLFSVLSHSLSSFYFLLSTLSEAVFLLSPVSFFQIARCNFACKITTKNPNVQVKFILFCHLQDFATVISGET